MIPTVLLALVPLWMGEVKQTNVIAGFKTLDECMVQAEQLNRKDKALQTPMARRVNLEYVCLVVKQWGI